MSISLQGALWRPGLPPGVYEESSPVSRRAEVSLDVTAFIGLAERGPLNTPVGIDDPAQFEAQFGRARFGLNLPQAVRLFFANGGRRCVVVRCMDHTNARTARLVLPGLDSERGGSLRQARIAARNPGAWGNRLRVSCFIRRSPLPLRLETRRVEGLVQAHYYAQAPSLETGTTLLLLGRPWRRGTPPRQRLARIASIGTGANGAREVTMYPSPIRGFRDNALLAYAQALSLRLEVRLDGELVEVWDDAALHPDHPRYLPRLIGRRAGSEALRPARTDLPDTEAPGAESDRIWGGLGEPWGSEYLRPSARLADAWLRPRAALIEAPTGLSESGDELPPGRQGRDAADTTDRDDFFDDTAMHADDALEDSDHRFVAFAFRRGPFAPGGALATWDAAFPHQPAALISLPDLLHPTAPEPTRPAHAQAPERPCFVPICLPSVESDTVPSLDYPRLGFDEADLRGAQRTVINACEAHGARIAMLDLPPGLAAAQVVAWRQALNSDRAALYAPWVRAEVNAVATDLPPSPAACGITALVERQTGVWAAPANRPISGVFARAADRGLPESGFLHAERIDEIRRTERGLLLLGSRTTSTDPQWTHLSVRRLIDWLKLQIAMDLDWAPFEPNDAALWSAMAGTARRRMQALFDAGALAGRTDSDSYFVRCDASTNTPVDLDAGRAQMLIGVAPAVPAEFIVFRLLRHGADDPRVEAR